MADGFLSRWSRRKGQADKQSELVEQGKDIAEPLKPVAIEEAETLPSASLEDVEKIDRFAPDFSAFMKPDVDPAVQQAALKKMFTDPHFNVMDGLDIYIGDYTKPDPLPPGMLERMVQSDMLNLFRKTSDDTTATERQSVSEASPVQTEQSALESSEKTDLTSTHSPAQVDSTHGDEIPVKPVQKKT